VARHMVDLVVEVDEEELPAGAENYADKKQETRTQTTVTADPARSHPRVGKDEDPTNRFTQIYQRRNTQP
jgi:hypothetical protein